MPWVCPACECEVEDDAAAACDACDEPRAAASPPPLIVVSLIVAIEAVPGKDKLRVVRLDVGSGGDPVAVVTSAPNVAVGLRCVVALPGALVAGDGGEELLVKAQAVCGVKSYGMLVDGPMLKWAGGGAGMAALVPDTFALGAAPPVTRPRLK